MQLEEDWLHSIHEEEQDKQASWLGLRKKPVRQERQREELQVRQRSVRAEQDMQILLLVMKWL